MKAYVVFFLLLGFSVFTSASEKKLKDLWHLKAPTLWAMFGLDTFTSLDKRREREKEIDGLLKQELAKADVNAARIKAERDLVDEVAKIINWNDYETLYSDFIASLAHQKVTLNTNAIPVPEHFSRDEVGPAFFHIHMLIEFRDWLRRLKTENTGKLSALALRENFSEFLASHSYSKAFPEHYSIKKDLWSGYKVGKEPEPWAIKVILNNLKLARAAMYIGSLCAAGLAGAAVTYHYMAPKPAEEMKSKGTIPEGHTTPGQIYSAPPKNPEREADKAIDQHKGFDPKKIDD